MMATYDNLSRNAWAYENLDSVEKKEKKNTSGSESLLKCKEPLIWYLGGLILYTIWILAIIGWGYSGPVYAGRFERVLSTSNLRVDQFYAGAASVSFLVPAAALIDLVCREFGLLHPFSIAHRVPVSAADMDTMIDTGVLSLTAVWKYSRRRAVMQAMLLLIGISVVPISSLILATGRYAPQTHGQGVVGLPAYPSNLMSLSKTMGYSGSGPFVSRFDDSDFFLTMLGDTFRGYVISRRAMLNKTPYQLGPTATVNMTFNPGVQYDGVVTFKWNSGCEAANDDIGYTISDQDGHLSVNFTFPDGSIQHSDTDVIPLFMWSNTTKTASGIPLGGTSYLAQTSLVKNFTSNISANEDAITAVGDGAWVSRVKCTPTMTWQVSSCIANGDSMFNCTDTPGKNTTGLDTVALDALSGYMTAVPWLLYLKNDYIFRMTLEPFYIMPTVEHYDSLLGVLAEAIASVTTAGYFGTATVPTIGESPKPVYVVRMYILFILLSLLYIAILLSVADLVYNSRKRLPFRKATFLTIAYAVHGRGLKEGEDCGCVKSRKELKADNKMMLQYGIDVKDRFHVGLAPNVQGWDREEENTINYRGTTFQLVYR